MKAIYATLYMTLLELMGREASPSAERGAVPDNEAGCEAGKQPRRRKIHALVDREELPGRVVVLLRRGLGRDSIGLVLDQIRERRSAGRTDMGR